MALLRCARVCGGLLVTLPIWLGYLWLHPYHDLFFWIASRREELFFDPEWRYTWNHQWQNATGASLSDGGPPQPLLTLVSMIPSPPLAFEKRDVIRLTLPELAGNVTLCGRPVRILVRFAVGGPRRESSAQEVAYVEELLAGEQRSHGDLAQLGIRDGFGGKNGKNWYIFEWASRAFPSADLIFKQDDDTLVNWNATVGRIFDRLAGGCPITLPLQHLVVGKQHSARPHCNGGSFYGLSGDVSRWVAAHMRPAAGNEDYMSCRWLLQYERFAARLDRRGLLPRPHFYGAWAHGGGLKDPREYFRCFHDRVSGCTVDEEKQHWLLPPRP